MTSKLELIQGDAPDLGDPIAAIQAILRKFPQARVESSSTRVTVLPLDASGFRVTFEVRATGCHVACEGWHEEFAAQHPALRCFMFALSPAARLRVTRRGGFSYRWELQGRTDSGVWAGASEVRLWFFPFWAATEVVYLQNRLLEAA
ncbi:MAG: hypothetical protein IPG75_10060 [Gemmatimonadetes bacterium]|nr:hypothetical protein [Gemmatimonadota bacterium]